MGMYKQSIIAKERPALSALFLAGSYIVQTFFFYTPTLFILFKSERDGNVFVFYEFKIFSTKWSLGPSEGTIDILNALVPPSDVLKIEIFRVNSYLEKR